MGRDCKEAARALLACMLKTPCMKVRTSETRPFSALAVEQLESHRNYRRVFVTTLDAHQILCSPCCRGYRSLLKFISPMHSLDAPRMSPVCRKVAV